MESHHVEHIHHQASHTTPHRGLGYHSDELSTPVERTKITKIIPHAFNLKSVNFEDATLEKDGKLEKL